MIASEVPLMALRMKTQWISLETAPERLVSRGSALRRLDSRNRKSKASRALMLGVGRTLCAVENYSPPAESAKINLPPPIGNLGASGPKP